MLSSDLLSVFKTQNAHLTTNSTGTTTVDHFGNPTQELQAIAESAAVCPIGDMIRIVATGADRAKFLHNFCTNNIKAMQPGDACEAFFTDVKAKILAHGYLLATVDSIEIMMLPGDQEAILKHLNRYIITEDVCITASETPTTTFAVMGPATFEILTKAELPLPANKANGCSFGNSATMFVAEWNSQPIAFLSVPVDRSVATWNSLTNSAATPSGLFAFNHQRILEGFPHVGIDITDANLAPEADRVTQAICYTKGCYLGQEPIARLDAMGHVNRKLYRCTATPTNPPQADAGTDLPLITSISQIESSSRPALTLLKVNAVVSKTPIFAKSMNNVVYELTQI